MNPLERNDALALLADSDLVIDEELCLNLRGRIEFCSACADQCHRDALELTTDAVTLLTERCTGCGGCVPACPAGVMRLTGFSPVRFLASAQGLEPLHLHCGESRDGGGGVVIPCFKLLDARLVAALAGEGGKEILLHGMAQCGPCPRGDARPVLAGLEARLEAWFGDRAPVVAEAAAGSGGAAGERKREDQPHMDRRHFLRLLGAKATAGATAWFCPAADSAEQEADLLPFFQADGQPRRPVIYQGVLAGRVERLPWRQDRSLPWRQDRSLPWRSRTIGEGCSACLVCAERCPTGALQAREQGPDREIGFDVSLCTDCGLCQRLCPEDAVVTGPVPDAQALQRGRERLMHRRASPCRGCGQPFLAEGDHGDLCPVCRNEQDLDDEWLAMLEG
ncbi:MAG TPA: hypothetical protein ENK50_09050 [Sedimenticola sp.]|nr:hypothetical protein [Sedimenticola sp.]